MLARPFPFLPMLSLAVLLSSGLARAEDERPVTSLVVKAKGKASVTVRGRDIQKKARPDEAIVWSARGPDTDGVIVRVDFGKDDFYEAYLELVEGSWLLEVPEGKGGALLQGKTKIPLSRGVPLVSFAKDKSWDFTAQQSPDGMPMFGPRYLAPGQKGTRIEQVILHATSTDGARAAFLGLVGRSLSSHLFIERDGTLVQALDFEQCGYHAGDRNSRSIGIDLVGRLDNVVVRTPQLDLTSEAPEPALELDGEDTAPPTRGGDPNAGVIDPTLLLPMGPALRVNGSLVQSYGYSARATRTLEAVLLALWRAYPTLGRHAAEDLRVVADPADPGVFGHWQVEEQRWDPGTGFDRARLARMARVVALVGGP